MAININTKELQDLLESTPATHNIMLSGKHGIGKSKIITDWFERRGSRVVTLFLGQMSDPGDLIGLPHKDEATGKTVFMPPYWFPTDDQPVVLFLDELIPAKHKVHVLRDADASGHRGLYVPKAVVAGRSLAKR